MALADLTQDPMMSHLIHSLEHGRDIGHYGRLVFVMVARHFLSDDEVVEYLTKDPGVDETAARSLVTQAATRDYNPPKRERVLEWMSKQKFPICPNPADPDECNVYKSLDFPKEIYEKIQSYYEGKAEAQR